MFRIFVIGDSVPRGSALKQAYPWLLQEDLRRQGVQAEVLNLCVSGYGARRSQVVLAKILEYDPSLVILHVNNSNEYEDEREYRRAQEFQGWHPRHWPMKLVICRRLYEFKMEQVCWRYLPENIRQRFAASDADAQVAASQNPAKVREWQQLVAETTAASAVLARQHRVPLILLSQCSALFTGPHAPRLDDTGLDDLARPLTGGNILLVSMKEAFAPTHFPRYFSDRVHLTYSGHQFLARALSRQVRELLPRYASAPSSHHHTNPGAHLAEKELNLNLPLSLKKNN